MKGKKFWKNEYLLVLIGAVLLSFLIFGNGIKGEFVFDDSAVIEKRGDLKDFSNIFNFFVSPYHQNMSKSGLYRPFAMATYALNYAIIGRSPAGFHIVNILIHAVNCLLVFWLVRFLFDNRKLAYFSALLFLFHPIHTEAITSIVGRAELLMFLFSLLSLYFFSRGKMFWSALMLLLGLWSKETAIMALPLMFWIGWWKLDFKPEVLMRKFIVYIIPLGIYFWLRFLALGKYFLLAGTTTIVENPLKFVSLSERIFTAFKVFYLYVEKLIWPVHLSADYSYNTIKIVSSPFASFQSILGIIIFAGMLFLIFYPKTRKSVWGLGSAIFILPYLLVSNFILPIGTIMGERTIYFSSAGFVVIIGFLLLKLKEKIKWANRLAYLLLAVLLIFWGARTVIRNKDWQNNESLFKAALKESADGLIVHTSLAAINIRQNNWEEAEKELQIAQNIWPDNSHELNLLGIVAEQKGDFKLAEERYKRSIELNKDAFNSYINLGKLLLKQNRYDEASQNFIKVIEFSPAEEYVLRYIYARIAANDPDSAIEMVNKYYSGRSDSADLNVAAGTAYFVKKDYQQALRYLNKAKELGSKLPEVEQMIKISEEEIK